MRHFPRVVLSVPSFLQKRMDISALLQLIFGLGELWAFLA